MDSKTLEGTREEVELRARELAGHRVRVSILDDPAPAFLTARTAGADMIPNHLIDHDDVASCVREADFDITLEEVRAAGGSIDDLSCVSPNGTKPW